MILHMIWVKDDLCAPRRINACANRSERCRYLMSIRFRRNRLPGTIPYRKRIPHRIKSLCLIITRSVNISSADRKSLASCRIQAPDLPLVVLPEIKRTHRQVAPACVISEVELTVSSASAIALQDENRIAGGPAESSLTNIRDAKRAIQP